MEILPYTNQYNVGFNSEKGWNSNVWTSPSGPTESERAFTVRLEKELRTAKNASDMSSVEVLLPSELLSRVARKALALSEQEPCGAKGAVVVVHLGERRLTAFPLEVGALCTHELHLHLEHDSSSWKNVLPQFLKNLTRASTVIISPQFTLSKKKLYRSPSDE